MEKRESENDLSAIQFDRERLEVENKAYKAMIEELLPIAEDGLYAVPVKSLEGVREAIDRARKLIDKL